MIHQAIKVEKLKTAKNWILYISYKPHILKKKSDSRMKAVIFHFLPQSGKKKKRKQPAAVTDGGYRM